MANLRWKKKAIRLATKVGDRFGIFPPTKARLFPAVAAALGVPWPHPQGGWRLVEKYAKANGLWDQALPPSKAVAPKANPAVAWALPKRKARFAAKDDFLQTYEWRRLRMLVLTKRGARCECCGASPKDGQAVLNIDHIKPRAKFPELALDEANLQVLCAACNHGKGNLDQTDWRVSVPSTDTVQ